jgi:Ca2+-binding EF-hand superfamily protein
MEMKHAQNRVDEIEELFDQADEDRDGQISLTEFRGLMLALDRDKHDSAVAAGFLEIDTDRDGRVGVGEFRAWWLSE